MGTGLRALPPNSVEAVAREEQIRFYLDADILGLAKILTQMRADVTYPGDKGRTVRKRTQAR